MLTLNLSCSHLAQSREGWFDVPRFAQATSFRLPWTCLAEGFAVEAVLLSALLLLPMVIRLTPDRTQDLRSPRREKMKLVAPPRLLRSQHESRSPTSVAHEGRQLSVRAQEGRSATASPIVDQQPTARLAQAASFQERGLGLPLPPPASTEPVLPVRVGVPTGAKFSSVAVGSLLPGARRLGSRPGPTDGEVIQRTAFLPSPTSPSSSKPGVGSGTDSLGGVLDGPRPNSPAEQTAYSEAVSDTRVSIISMPRPEYTTCARQNRLEGSVHVRALFASTGVVTDTATIGQPVGCGLEETAQAAVRGAKFKPARSGGKEVNQWVVVVARFQLAVQTLSVQ